MFDREIITVGFVIIFLVPLVTCGFLEKESNMEKNMGFLKPQYFWNEKAVDALKYFEKKLNVLKKSNEIPTDLLEQSTEKQNVGWSMFLKILEVFWKEKDIDFLEQSIEKATSPKCDCSLKEKAMNGYKRFMKNLLFIDKSKEADGEKGIKEVQIRYDDLLKQSTETENEGWSIFRIFSPCKRTQKKPVEANTMKQCELRKDKPLQGIKVNEKKKSTGDENKGWPLFGIFWEIVVRFYFLLLILFFPFIPSDGGPEQQTIFFALCFLAKQLLIYHEVQNIHTEELCESQEVQNTCPTAESLIFQEIQNTHSEELLMYQEVQNTHPEESLMHQEVQNTHPEELFIHQEVQTTYPEELLMHQEVQNTHPDFEESLLHEEV